MQSMTGFRRVGGGASALTSHSKGFTLAEVLITLGIIGVVAALTIPTLINNYMEKVTVNKVKKFYSVLSNAVALATVDNGSVEMWDFQGYTPDGTREFFDYIKPYFKIAKDCGSNNNMKCIFEGNMYYLSGELYAASSFYANSDTYYKAVLSDGSSFWMRTNSSCEHQDSATGVQNVCAIFWFDANGLDQPNTLGKDIFVFYIQPFGVIPHSSDDCYLDSDGWGCAKFIMQNGNMNYPEVKKEAQ